MPCWRICTSGGATNSYPVTGRWSTDAERELPTATPARVAELITAIAREAGVYMWFLAIVGGSAWKIEACLARFGREHLADTIDPSAARRSCCAALPRPAPSSGHAVQSVDWYHPVAAELPPSPRTERHHRHRQLVADREAAQPACRAALGPGRLLAEFDGSSRSHSAMPPSGRNSPETSPLGWPVLRACAAASVTT